VAAAQNGVDQQAVGCRLRVNFGLSQPTAVTSAFGGTADANDAKADMPAAMSAVEGRADVACQELSGPFLAMTDHSRTLPVVSQSKSQSELKVGQWITCLLSVGKCEFDPQKTATHSIFFVVAGGGR